MDYLGPIQGFIVGTLLIVFRSQVAAYIEKGMTRFPKYEDGEKHFKLQYSVKPIYLVVLGVIFILIATAGLLSRLAS